MKISFAATRPAGDYALVIPSAGDNRPGLAPIVDVMNASRKTISVIRRSLAASLAYNTFSVALAALGLINPLVAAILMPISSITVMSLAFSVRTFDTRRKP